MTVFRFSALPGLRFSVLPTLTALVLLGACKDDTQAKTPVATPAGPSAAASLDLTDFRHEMVDGRHRYVHQRRFSEAAGVAATITRGKVCVQNGTECVDALTKYALPANGEFVQPNSHFATPLAQDRVTLEYWLTDANGHELTLKRVVETRGETATVVGK